MDKDTPLGLLKQKKAELVTDFLEKKSSDFLEQHTWGFDDYFRNSFEKSVVGPKMEILHNPYSIIALGGYGRGELCVHSDIDLLFLFKKAVPPEAEVLIREVVYPLWDLGLDIGYATRSIKECLSIANQDIEVLTSLLDARFICGASLSYSELMEQLRKKITRRKPEKLIRTLVENNRIRHQRFGDSTYLLEPNLKEGQGGIRDYHTILWIAKIESAIIKTQDLELNGYLSHGGYQALLKTLAFIWDVRSRLHYLAGRKCDQLHFEFQTELAKTMRFDSGNGQQPVEIFLGQLHGHMESLKQQYLMFLLEHGYETEKKRVKRTSVKTNTAGIIVKDGMLYFTSSKNILKAPDLLIRVFEESSRLKTPLSAEAKQLVQEFGYLIDDALRLSPSILTLFEQILIKPSPYFNVLNEMLASGFLPQFIPAFKGIVNRIQYDEYHLYPVDKHSLMTVRTIKKFATSEAAMEEPLCHDLYKELSSKKVLLWAALLHDIGKGEPGKGHSQKGAAIAASILSKFGLESKEVETVSFLIREHLLLVKIATRRDLNDEETAISCARKIKKAPLLKMLYLLTVADSIATGPKAWNNWTASLLQTLFLKVLSIIEKGELATSKAVASIKKKKNKLLASVSMPRSQKDMEALFRVMSPRYQLYTSAQDMLEHLKLYKCLGAKSFVWNITKTSNPDTRTVTVCANDRPGIFSKIAGTFTLNSISILGCQIYTWRNNIALDIFEVTAPPDPILEEERWLKAEETLRAALTGELDLAMAISKKMTGSQAKPCLSEKPNQVIVDNNSSNFFTIIEVFTSNLTGLLFRITDALFRCGLDIWVAKIATKVDQVVDVFYVRDFDGQKITAPHQLDTVKKEIASVLQGN
jgi:[protein-PII] uridylyltransferase